MKSRSHQSSLGRKTACIVMINECIGIIVYVKSMKHKIGVKLMLFGYPCNIG